ncbi:cilia- and flagella-associated protein 263 isoform X2 [Strix aluco]|uniref:cilia- and flagella-associated protein 263 isoform X2 n=1 Tax=Strix aluco TaxID=111821 RepID=UPI003DA4BD4E
MSHVPHFPCPAMSHVSLCPCPPVSPISHVPPCPMCPCARVPHSPCPPMSHVSLCPCPPCPPMSPASCPHVHVCPCSISLRVLWPARPPYPCTELRPRVLYPSASCAPPRRCQETAMADRGLAALPLPQLRAKLQEERDANTLLRTEVEMFEKWCRKMEPCGPSLQLLPQPHDAPPEVMQIRGRYKSKLHSVTDCIVGLTVEQKCELVERELTEVKDEIQRMKEDSEQTLQNLEAVIEEADVWWADIKKAISDFEKDIMSTMSSKKGSLTASEKVLRYLEEKNRQRDLLREKLLSKNYLLKDYKKKLEQQLRQVQIWHVSACMG